MKIIIVGAGEVGFHIAKRLSEEGQDVVVIDRDAPQIKKINENLDVQAFLGSGTSPRLLKETGIKEAGLLVAASIGNIGPGLGMVGPVNNFFGVPLAGKWVLIFCMLLGRLEIYTVIVLIAPEFWRK